MVVANRVRDSSGKLYAYCKWHKLVADSPTRRVTPKTDNRK